MALQVGINFDKQLGFQTLSPKIEQAGASHMPYVHVLHLSDLHFTEPTQAEVWSHQLMADLEEMSISRVDALVLSGDLTQQATDWQFKAAHQSAAHQSDRSHH
ncbi:MAG: hypothetical protein ACKO6N_07770 [Myxococcota bacterium]